jgi:hypothetical protein
MTMTYRVVVPLAALLGGAVAAGAAADKLTATLRGCGRVQLARLRCKRPRGRVAFGAL